MDRWLEILSNQSGLECTRAGRSGVDLRPRLTLQSTAPQDDFELAVQVPTQASYELTVGDKVFTCACRESPVAPGKAVYVEYAQPDAAIRHVIVPGDAVSVKLVASWTTARRERQEQVLFDGHFVVPEKLHLTGAPGYNVDVPHLGTQMYFCVGLIGTQEKHHTEILSWHLTLLY
jgi:hypothetical protein